MNQNTYRESQLLSLLSLFSPLFSVLMVFFVSSWLIFLLFMKIYTNMNVCVYYHMCIKLIPLSRYTITILFAHVYFKNLEKYLFLPEANSWDQSGKYILYHFADIFLSTELAFLSLLQHFMFCLILEMFDFYSKIRQTLALCLE